MKNLNEKIGKGIGGSQAITLRQALEDAYKDQDWEKLNELIKADRQSTIDYWLDEPFF